MKIDDRKTTEPQKTEPAKPFADVLKKAAPMKPAMPQKAPAPQKPAAPAPKLPVAPKPAAKPNVAVTAQRRVEVRGREATLHHETVLARAHQTAATDSKKEHARSLRTGLHEALSKEVERKETTRRDESMPPRVEALPTVATIQNDGVNNAQPVQAPAAAEKVASIEAMVTRIEAALKGTEPQLAVTLQSAVAAKVEVTRHGRGEISVKISGNGKVGREALQATAAELSESLKARRLTVRTIKIA